MIVWEKEGGMKKYLRRNGQQYEDISGSVPAHRNGGSSAEVFNEHTADGWKWLPQQSLTVNAWMENTMDIYKKENITHIYLSYVQY